MGFSRGVLMHVQSSRQKHWIDVLNDVANMFKVNNKDTLITPEGTLYLNISTAFLECRSVDLFWFLFVVINSTQNNSEST